MLLLFFIPFSQFFMSLFAQNLPSNLKSIFALEYKYFPRYTSIYKQYILQLNIRPRWLRLIHSNIYLSVVLILYYQTVFFYLKINLFQDVNHTNLMTFLGFLLKKIEYFARISSNSWNNHNQVLEKALRAIQLHMWTGQFCWEIHEKGMKQK